MRYCRFALSGEPAYGLVEGAVGSERITRLLTKAPHITEDDIEDLPSRKIEPVALADADLLPPVEPTKIVCVGRNYREHAAELGNEVPAEPLLFFKPPSSLLAPGLTIRRPKLSQRVDHEGELGVIIRRKCYKLCSDEDVRSYVRGYTCVNDVTARDLQNKDGQWTRAKGFDTFCPVGPVVTDELDPWTGVEVETRVNQDVRQKGNTRDFIFPLDVIIRYISQAMTLCPGDLIATGTPKGVGPLHAGEMVSVTVEDVGTLSNPVEDE